jgi:signal transduction histidine kinase
MPRMAEREYQWSRNWTLAGIGVIGIALILAAAGTVLAIRQTQSLARLRISDLRQEAQLLRDSIQSDSLPRLARFLEQVAFNRRKRGLSNPIGAGDAPPWVSEVYLYDPGASSMIFDRWQRDPTGRWDLLQAPDSIDESDDQLSVAIVSHLLPPYMALQFGPRTTAMDFVCDVVNGEPLAIAHIAESKFPQSQTIVAARIDLDAFARAEIDPQLTGNRIGVRTVLPDEMAGLRRALAWHEDFAPMAPFLWLAPTPQFVSRQHGVVQRQTILFVVGVFLVMGALVAVMWAMWRVLQRELALSRMKQAFVADVSHELKTPLALIRLFGETLLSGRVPTDEKKREYYEIITRESDRLTHLINNILDFARIDAGKKRYQFQPANIAGLIRETYEAYTAQLDHAQFEHQLVVADDLPEITCDRDAVAQALINLINNAMKYHDGGDRFLGIDVSRETRRGRHGVLISVSDRGIGIKPEDRNRLFTDFYRANDDRVRSQRGAGLGLALVKHIVDGHDGIVDVESRLVKGSTFRIFLPIQPDNAQPQNAENLPPS